MPVWYATAVTTTDPTSFATYYCPAANGWGFTGGPVWLVQFNDSSGVDADYACPAHLTLTKSVVNTDGGTAVPRAWTLSATGPTTISGLTGDAAITSAAVNAGTYTLAESGGPTGYTPGAWSCTGGTLTGSSLVLAAGDTASCSITNTFTKTF